MKHLSMSAVGALVLLGAISAHVIGQTKVWTVTYGDELRQLPPEVADPKASILYRSTLTGGWQAAAVARNAGSLSPALISYCVFPSIKVTGRKDAKKQLPWTVPFDLALVNAAGAPAAPEFQPIHVPPGDAPIPAGTTLELRPDPKWCASIAGTSTPPEIYLQVDARRERVLFAPLPPAPRALPSSGPR